MKIEVMYHVGITVGDLERSIEFYRDVLGLTLYRRQRGTADYLAAITGLPGVRLEIALLRTPDGSGMLELLQYASHPAPATDRATNRPGNVHVCFTAAVELFQPPAGGAGRPRAAAAGG